MIHGSSVHRFRRCTTPLFFAQRNGASTTHVTSGAHSHTPYSLSCRCVAVPQEGGFLGSDVIVGQINDKSLQLRKRIGLALEKAPARGTNILAATPLPLIIPWWCVLLCRGLQNSIGGRQPRGGHRDVRLVQPLVRDIHPRSLLARTPSNAQHRSSCAPTHHAHSLPPPSSCPLPPPATA